MMSTLAHPMAADSEIERRALPPAPTPRRTVVDDEGRHLTLESRAGEPSAELEGELVALYDRFGATGRAQGIPPASASRRQTWLEDLLAMPGVGVVVRHETGAVAHGRLLGDGDGPAELAVFVAPEYRGAGVGTELLGALLAAGRERGLPAVVLSVERSNTAAIRLYRGFGFEELSEGRCEVEMRRPL